MEKFGNKYRIPSARLQNWDYGWNAAYFVTICTKDKEHFFGEIEKTHDTENPFLMRFSEIGQKRFQNQGKHTLSSIIGSYKSVVTKHVRKIYSDFAWQPRFHDHIIRNDASFQRIRDYIENNLKTWKDDTFFCD